MRTKLVARIPPILLAFASLSAAQTPAATLVGRIVDASHAGIVGAGIRVRNVDTNDVRNAQSKIDGQYTISSLAPGTCEAMIEKAGFRQLKEQNLVLQVDQTARLDAQLQIGAVSQTVEVEATVPLLNTETSAKGDVIAPNEITEMPLNGRDFNDLAFMVAGVQAAEQGGKGSPYVVNGARADASNVTIDGLNDFNPRDAGAHSRPPLDSLQEFKLQTSGFSAEYGRLAGGVVPWRSRAGATSRTCRSSNTCATTCTTRSARSGPRRRRMVYPR